MPIVYFIYLLTFLVYPVIGLVIGSKIVFEDCKVLIVWLAGFFSLHNMLFFSGYSMSGDYPDYLIFSFEYLLFCTVVSSLLYSDRNAYTVVLRSVGAAAIVLGFVQGLIGVFLFIVIAQDYEADKVYSFTSEEANYQTRRYCFSFATLDDTRYTFETYKKYKSIPIERLINHTNLSELNSPLDLNDKNFTVAIKRQGTQQVLEFKSSQEKGIEIAVE